MKIKAVSVYFLSPVHRPSCKRVFNRKKLSLEHKPLTLPATLQRTPDNLPHSRHGNITPLRNNGDRKGPPRRPQARANYSIHIAAFYKQCQVVSNQGSLKIVITHFKIHSNTIYRQYHEFSVSSWVILQSCL